MPKLFHNVIEFPIISTYLAHTFVQIILEGYNSNSVTPSNKITGTNLNKLFGTYWTNSTKNRKPSFDFASL